MAVPGNPRIDKIKKGVVAAGLWVSFVQKIPGVAAGSNFCGALDLNEIQQLGKNEKATGRGRMWEKKRNCAPCRSSPRVSGGDWVAMQPPRLAL
jgi:hypothetical protein